MDELWAIDVVCSDPACTEELEVFLTDLDELDWVVCECGHTMIAVSVSTFEPVLSGRP